MCIVGGNGLKTQNINIWGSSKPKEVLTSVQKELQEHFKEHSRTSANQRGEKPTQTFPQLSVPSKFMASYDCEWKLPAVNHWAGPLPVQRQLFDSLLRSSKEQTAAIPTSQNPLLSAA